MIDGGHGFGPVAVMEGAARAVERAKQTGVCFALIRHTTHTGAIGRYAQWIAGRGCATLLMGAGPTLMAYHGARVASMATSPIAIAVPSSNGLIALDMSSSTISNGKILQARATGAALPEGTVLTAAGEPTTDPKQAETLLPLGGPKGSGLAFMFEMLASVLAAAPIQAPALSPQKRARHTANTAMLVIDIETFRPLIDFQADADALAAVVKALPRRAGFDEILLPGERGNRTEAARRKTGIPIPAKLWEELAAMAKAEGGQDAGYRGSFVNLRTQSAGSVAAARPPFRAEHIGSLLRPAKLLRERARVAKGEINAAELAAAEDDAITDAIRLQERLGFKFVTDGEFRRRSYHSFFYGALGQLMAVPMPSVRTNKADAAHSRSRSSAAACNGHTPSMPATRASSKPARIAGRRSRFRGLARCTSAAAMPP
jgi:ureidoglycolate dehydrogenase (NAD+)